MGLALQVGTHPVSPEDVTACPQFSESAAAACLATYEAWTCTQVREDYLPDECATVCSGS